MSVSIFSVISNPSQIPLYEGTTLDLCQCKEVQDRTLALEGFTFQMRRKIYHEIKQIT